ncbi:MAG: hypothetical protein HFJ75_07725 [Eggerthellaceae bacterium]|nr:hypothetical protein [Eggerthellaceae bacterium]
MASDDLPVIVYKILAYLYECMKHELPPSVSQAKELCEANDTMFAAAAKAATEKGYASGIECKRYITGGSEVVFKGASVTLDGVEYLQENSTMRKAASVAGSAFRVALDVAMQALMRATGAI